MSPALVASAFRPGGATHLGARGWWRASCRCLVRIASERRPQGALSGAREHRELRACSNHLGCADDSGADRRLGFVEPQPIPQAQPLVQDPVVVIVGIDAIRGDVLNGGQYDPELRNLSRLRDGGAYFANAIAPGSQTSVTYTSMFSGRYFSQLHWAYHGSGKARRLYAAADSSPRVAELLGEADVRTVSFISPGFLRGDFGIARGFEEEKLVSMGHAHARELMRPLLKELRTHRDGGALFFVHFMDAHEPYDRGPLKAGPAKQRYLSELHALDSRLGALIRVMRRTFPDRGYIVVLADHGEAFGEHGTTFHSKTLYQELIHVPLIFYGPGIAAKRHDEWVSLIDVAPTLLALYGQAVPAFMMGESLLPALVGQPQPRRVRPNRSRGSAKARSDSAGRPEGDRRPPPQDYRSLRFGA